MSRTGYTEKRRASRYRVSLPVELEQGSGETRDISESGMFFETDQPFALGQAIRFSVLLAHAIPGITFRLRGEGPIVRMERRDDKVGVAVALSAIRLEPYE